MTVKRMNSRFESKDEANASVGVTEAQVDEFLRKLLEVQRRFLYEKDKKSHADLRMELRRHARIILGAGKQVIK
jgi:hypothetical protein